MLLPLFFAFGLIVNTSTAVSAYTGSEFLTDCETFIQGQSAIVDYETLAQNVSCGRFIQGVVDTLRFTESTLVCIPENYTPGQLARIFLKFAQDNPQHLHFTAGSLLVHTLQQAYPCN
ncbi:Rap1a/Tai family immunity protein [Roseibium hamelinense]